MDFLTLVTQSGISIITSLLAAYGSVQFIGKKLIDKRFAEQIEKLKHNQNQEMERVRYYINSQFDRTTTLHNQEFEILPEIWDKTNHSLLNYFYVDLADPAVSRS